MPNKNYQKGYRAEQRARRELEAVGWATHRSGGSHGVDIVGVGYRIGGVLQVLYASIKYGKRRPVAADRLELRDAPPEGALPTDIIRQIRYYAPRQPVEIISVA